MKVDIQRLIAIIKKRNIGMNDKAAEDYVVTAQCRWVGVLYFIFAWFMGNGSLVDSGRTTYDQVAYWLFICSIGWTLVFLSRWFRNYGAAKINLALKQL